MNDVKMDKRPYRSPLRAEQAEATRQRIVDAGLALFAERGYPGTSVTEIARAAGVSAETIYGSVGSKRGIIDLLLAQVETEGVAERAREAVAARGGGSAVALDVLAELSVAFWQQHGTLARVLRNGVGDPEIGAAWTERQRGRRAIIHGLIESWPEGTLRTGLDAGRAADVAWALTSDEVHELLVGLRDWPPEAFLAWLRSTLAREILAEPAPET
jgi:AcrR family transcriptional regulator